MDVANGSLNRQIDAALEIHRIHAGRNSFCTLTHNGLSEDGRRRRAVTGNVVRLGRHFLHHLGAHVLELIFQLNFLGDGDTVLRDARCAEGLVDHHVASFRTQSDPDGVGQDIDAPQQPVAGIGGKLDVF